MSYDYYVFTRPLVLEVICKRHLSSNFSYFLLFLLGNVNFQKDIFIAPTHVHVGPLQEHYESQLSSISLSLINSSRLKGNGESVLQNTESSANNTTSVFIPVTGN